MIPAFLPGQSFDSCAESALSSGNPQAAGTADKGWIFKDFKFYFHVGTAIANTHREERSKES